MKNMKQAYLKASIKKLKQGEFNLTIAIKSFPSPEEIDTAELGLCFANLILAKIQTMTPREFMQLFPVKKEFDGERFGWKDYFYTMKFIKEYGLDRKIEKPTDFLWEYQNDDICKFLVNYMGFISRAYKEETGREMILDGMEHAHIPYEAYADNFQTIINYDGQGTKVVMPNLAMWL